MHLHISAAGRSEQAGVLAQVSKLHVKLYTFLRYNADVPREWHCWPANVFLCSPHVWWLCRWLYTAALTTQVVSVWCLRSLSVMVEYIWYRQTWKYGAILIPSHSRTKSWVPGKTQSVKIDTDDSFQGIIVSGKQSFHFYLQSHSPPVS